MVLKSAFLLLKILISLSNSLRNTLSQKHFVKDLDPKTKTTDQIII